MVDSPPSSLGTSICTPNNLKPTQPLLHVVELCPFCTQWQHFLAQPFGIFRELSLSLSILTDLYIYIYIILEREEEEEEEVCLEEEGFVLDYGTVHAYT